MKHTNEEWRNFSDNEIAEMAEDALSWWNENKKEIFALMDKLENLK